VILVVVAQLTSVKPWASLFTLHCCSSISCVNNELAIIDSEGNLFTNRLHTLFATWLDASQRCWDDVLL